MSDKRKMSPVDELAPEESSSRPKRVRAAPKRLNDDLLQSTPTKSPSKKPKTTKHLSRASKDVQAELKAAQTKANNRKKANYSPNHLLTAKGSLLAKIDLGKMLSDDRAWSVLSPEQKLKLLSFLPNAPETAAETVNEDVPSIFQQCLRDNSAFKSDVRKFQDDLINGYCDPKWQAKANVAMKERANGDFDAWKDEETELWWGQKSKE